jgi:hypothetical protein
MRSMQIGHEAEENFRPYRHLAIRVLVRAFLDLTDPARSSTERESARVFLAGSGMLRHWCRVAALDPVSVVSHAEQLAENRVRFSPASLAALVAQGLRKVIPQEQRGPGR